MAVHKCLFISKWSKLSISWIFISVLLLDLVEGLPKMNESCNPQQKWPCYFSLECENNTATSGICTCRNSTWSTALDMCLLKEGSLCFRNRLCASGICRHNNCYDKDPLLVDVEDPTYWYLFFIGYNGIIIGAWMIARLIMWCKRMSYDKIPRKGYFEYEMRDIDAEYRQALLNDEVLYGIEYDLPEEVRHPPPPAPIDWF